MRCGTICCRADKSLQTRTLVTSRSRWEGATLQRSTHHVRRRSVYFLSGEKPDVEVLDRSRSISGKVCLRRIAVSCSAKEVLVMKRGLLVSWLTLAGIGTVPVSVRLAASGAGLDRLSRINHVVVIYQENHSFDNLYGGWEGVNGLAAAPTARTAQVDQRGRRFDCLMQVDTTLAATTTGAACTDPGGFTSRFTNDPFTVDDYIAPDLKNCPYGTAADKAVAGGCTKDLVHRFYQEQYQLNGGRQNRYVTGSDSVGLTMGTYNTQELPIYSYLHVNGHPHYAIADNFFQAAFGGSFLNHQWLIAAATPTWPGAVKDGSAGDFHSILDVNRMPTSYPLYKSPAAVVKDSLLTADCDKPRPSGILCGDYAVNTIQPTYQPYAPG